MNRQSFDQIWNRIIALEGESFSTVRGLEFVYSVDGQTIVPDRTDFPLHKANFEKAYEDMPVEGPGSLSKDIMGPSYVWAILNDERVSRSDSE